MIPVGRSVQAVANRVVPPSSSVDVDVQLSSGAKYLSASYTSTLGLTNVSIGYSLDGANFTNLATLGSASGSPVQINNSGQAFAVEKLRLTLNNSDTSPATFNVFVLAVG